MTRKEIRTLRDIIGSDPILLDEEIEYIWMSMDRQDPMKPDWMGLGVETVLESWQGKRTWLDKNIVTIVVRKLSGREPMREILFRGKRIDNGEWVYGSLIRMDDGGHQTFIFPPYNKASSLSCGQLVAWGMIAVIPETVGQDTGLKDKKVKKIFDGDVLDKEFYCGWYVGYEDGAFCRVPNNDIQRNNWEHYRMKQKSIEDWEVIGNIHDNPELVED